MTPAPPSSTARATQRPAPNNESASLDAKRWQTKNRVEIKRGGRGRATAAGGWAIADCTGLGCSRRAKAARQSSVTSERKGRRHQVSFTAGEIPGPILHHHDPPVEEIGAGIGDLGLGAEDVGKTGLGDLAGDTRSPHPVAERGAKTHGARPGSADRAHSCETGASCKGRPTWAGKTNDEPGKCVRDCSSTPSAAPGQRNTMLHRDLHPLGGNRPRRRRENRTPPRRLRAPRRNAPQ